MSLSKPAKIGIITVWKWICRQDNYGSVLQAWALKTVLERLGYQPEILRLASTQEERYREDALRVKFKYLRLLFTWGRMRRKLLMRIRRANHPCHFMEFARKELPLSSWNASLAEASWRIYEAYDALIVGSDQVWNEVAPLYFLKVRSGPALRLAYAVSRNWSQLDPSVGDALLYWIKDRNYPIGCREQIGVERCAHEGIPATWVCDPTLLLTAEEWQTLFVPATTASTFAYFVNTFSKSLQACLEERAQQTGLPQVWIGVQGAEGDVDPHYAAALTPYEWCAQIASAKEVITNSFHALCFALLFKRPFVLVDTEGSHRQLELLKYLNLECRHVSHYSEIDAVLARPIDWDEVQEKLAHFRHASLAFLTDALQPLN